MKKIVCFASAMLMILALCACSLEYSAMAEEGPFSYAYGKKSAFIYEYRWDGTEEGRTVEIPGKIGELKVEGIGGFFGRGLQMPFDVDISEWFDSLPGQPVEVTTSNGEKPVPDETVYIEFTVCPGPGVKNIKLYGNESWFREDGGRITEYVVRSVIKDER